LDKKEIAKALQGIFEELAKLNVQGAKARPTAIEIARVAAAITTTLSEVAEAIGTQVITAKNIDAKASLEQAELANDLELAKLEKDHAHEIALLNKSEHYALVKICVTNGHSPPDRSDCVKAERRSVAAELGAEFANDNHRREAGHLIQQALDTIKRDEMLTPTEIGNLTLTLTTAKELCS